MKQRISYQLAPSRFTAWIAGLVLLCSAGCSIASYGIGGGNVWMTLILPLAAGLLYALILLISGREHLYRTAIPLALWLVLLAATSAVPGGWLTALVWAAALIVLIVYDRTFRGKISTRWPAGLILLVLLALEVWLARTALTAQMGSAAWFGAANRCCLALGIFLTIAFMRRHDDGAYHPIWGDRADGRRIRDIPPITYVTPYIMPDRNGANNSIRSCFEITEAEKYIHAKRREGLTNFGFTHVFLASYVRAVAQYPALNRFLSGQHIYTRDNDIQFCMIIKKDMTLEAPDTAIKLHLSPSDNANDVYDKFNAAVEEVKNAPLDSTFDKTAQVLKLIPGVLLKFTVWVLKVLDYFGLLPGFLLEVSPFHGSVFFTSMGSLGIEPVIHHLYNFGNLPMFIAFGRKRRQTELDENGEPVSRRYVDYTVNIDERTVDGFYYASALRYFHRLVTNPTVLDEKPETVVRDID